MAALPDSIELSATDSSPSIGRTIVLRDLRRLDPSSIPAEVLRSTVDEHLALLQGSVQAIQDVVVHLRYLRNTKAPINRLPSEVLVHVFFHSVSTSPNEHDLVNATHVCKWWREVALDYSWLWSTLSVTTLDKATTFLQRAKDNLIAIVIRDRVVVHLFTPTLLCLIPRLLWLVVEAQDTVSIIPIVKALATSAAPYLETFRVVGNYNHDGEREAAYRFNTQSMLELRSSDPMSVNAVPQAPKLRHLCLSPVMPPWGCHIYSNLSVLELGCPLSRLQISELAFLRILRHCPTLERLNLEIQLVAPFVLPEDPQPIVRLPMLSQITFHGFPHAHVAKLLTRLVLPATTRYEIFGSAVDVFGQQLGPLEPSTRLADLKDFRMAEVLVGHPGARDILCYFFQSATLGPADPLMTLYMPDTLGRHGTVPAVHLGIPGSIDVLMLRGCEKGILERYVDLDWIPVFQSLVYLRVLHLMDIGSAQALLYLLNGLGPLAVNHDWERYGDSPGSGWPCPELEALELVGVTLSGKVEAIIIEWLRVRADAGIALSTVTLARVDRPSGSFLRNLQKLGVAVHVMDSPPEWYADTKTFTGEF
ncbi:uncharacterized protein TRAVEDRAFT_46091 [Trametes versicolor FP-101664 SS1]|uniref:uncharacterized protein n=1 Tax=Trametes versicolor (strain FP-101664) TaxID=717944 RepID=UPI000462294E|nr:uncharacterized protein TRAVEDRAFT_46091 [Trametes versicolor FP-101664 SS1]EIW60853.1 hypothetical protein TRAVEDRAFT_46091 [Trametes versicolor FP-101664 SS1]